MSGKYILGTVTLLLILPLVGCQGAKTTGNDPLLGKTRLDPLQTYTRSVYVERPNVHDSGVIPANQRELASKTTTDDKEKNDAQSSNNSSPVRLSTAPGGSRLVRYPTDLDRVSEANPEKTATPPETSTNSSHLRWISVPQPTTQSSNPLTTSNGNDFLTPTEEELRTYQYIYDFSAYPPRRRAIRKSNESSEVASANPYQPTVTLLPDTSALGKTQTIPTPQSAPSNYTNAQFFSKDFDPYAPNRTYERKRAALSRDMETIFDHSPEPVLVANPSVTPSPTPALSSAPTPTAIVQNPAPATGWQVVSTPSYPSSLNLSPTVAEIVPTTTSVGTQVTLPPEKKASQLPPPQPQTIVPHNGSINILDLPEW